MAKSNFYRIRFHCQNCDFAANAENVPNRLIKETGMRMEGIMRQHMENNPDHVYVMPGPRKMP